jgi:hypothetical protein
MSSTVTGGWQSWLSRLDKLRYVRRHTTMIISVPMAILLTPYLQPQ